MISHYSLAGKTVLVTGGAGEGVGGGISRAVLEAKGRLIMAGRSAKNTRELQKSHPDAISILGDVSDETEVERMFSEAEAETGGVDYLVNNAGIGLSKSVDKTEVSDFDRLYAVDLRGVWLMTRRYLQARLEAGQGGAIVNVSSVHAHSTMARYASYAGVKAGVEGLTRGVAVEYGPKGIRCNAISPGYVHAEQNLELISTWTDDPQGWVKRHSESQQALNYEISALDCGRVAVFLLSDAARCVTGQCLYVDNGMTSMLYNRDFV